MGNRNYKMIEVTEKCTLSNPKHQVSPDCLHLRHITNPTGVCQYIAYIGQLSKPSLHEILKDSVEIDCDEYTRLVHLQAAFKCHPEKFLDEDPNAPKLPEHGTQFLLCKGSDTFKGIPDGAVLEAHNPTNGMVSLVVELTDSVKIGIMWKYSYEGGCKPTTVFPLTAQQIQHLVDTNTLKRIS